MAPQIYLSLAFHNHQPVGNFGWVFEDAFEKAYLPMVECLEQHPSVRVALHYTGPLRDWILENRPDFFPRLRLMVERGQVEIMSGGYYEPILVSLSDADKLGQIKKLNEAVQDDFGIQPTGMWLAERVWEPHLPRPLAMTGVRYTIVDDAHFKGVGYRDEDLFGYYVTEEQGHKVSVFASSMELRYSIPYQEVDHIIDWLREQANPEGSDGRYIGRTKVAVMGDDGEKFGIWPGTYDHVWKNGWMDRFFSALEENSDWLETISPGQVLRTLPSLGRIYLPTSSYSEMGEWSLPPDEAWELPHLKHQLEQERRPVFIRYMRGGFWRQFMVKYEEVNQLHKRAMWVSRKVHAMPEGKAKEQALDHLWAGQCNCGYWHGLFGGIYLFHIREADYRHLISAENLADGLGDDEAEPFAHVEATDFDGDLRDNLVVTTDRQNMVFRVEHGGALVEWDYRPAAYNLLNVMTRQREGYHKDLVAAAEADAVITPDRAQSDVAQNIHSDTVRAREANLQNKLIYDWHRRASFLDHFLGDTAKLDHFYRSKYEELGDFVNQPYKHEIEETKDGYALLMRRHGQVWQKAIQVPVTIEKRFFIQPGSDQLLVDYRLTNGEGGPLSSRFGIETNWGFAGGDDENNAYLSVGFGRFSLGEIAADNQITDFTITSDLWKTQIDVLSSRPTTMWRFPLETISNSEAGFERNYQGSTMLLWWPIRLVPGGVWEVTLTFDLKQLPT